ncbi:hypothetical protein NRV22_001223 [Staphylococcus pseudintermedius]|uniref:DUF5986 family protein n=2 Tax=Staphylococcus pseudintermedius TaxID=283734 RepID=UPI0011233214|nr:DUF5986 family protein [Staphylococcus pseudintermedius]EGQ0303629.1 hypothetical protein [Staphylococcus pseudintermedius]EGQ0305930.1 hypothetical protein [Staphylococcus pseudintermedius]EGQ0372848.1 hypothetical protein [Staphylococcus pseudintermedius]EGQ1281274.1 hypothetical protein [Staphylococcus pseudintermedius]EGQ1308674.1 hypothetical protein [Staphylococcus pseudintermedius]
MLKVKEEILKFIVNTCVNKDQESIKTYEFGIGKTGEENVDNGRAIALWNMIYNNFINNGSAAGIVPLKIHRGNIWTAVAAYIESTGEFIMVFKKANLKKIMSNPNNGHYATIANTSNGNLLPIQQEFFPSSEFDEGLIFRYELLCDELFKKIGVIPKKVILAGFTEFEFKTYIYNKRQQLVAEHDYSYLIDSRYDDLLKEQYDVTPPFKEINRIANKRKEPRKRINGLKKN